jgi:hypothetical protein
LHFVTGGGGEGVPATTGSVSESVTIVVELSLIVETKSESFLKILSSI